MGKMRHCLRFGAADMPPQFMSTLRSLGALIYENSAPSEEQGAKVDKIEDAHDRAYLEEGRITILRNILPDDIASAKKKELLVTCIEMLDDTLGTIGVFDCARKWFAKKRRSANLDDELQLCRESKLFRENSHYSENASRVDIPVSRDANRNQSIGKIRRTLSGLAADYQYDKILVIAVEYEKEYTNAPVTADQLRMFDKDSLLAKIVTFPKGSVHPIGTSLLKRLGKYFIRPTRLLFDVPQTRKCGYFL